LDFPVFAAEAGAAAPFFGTVRRRLLLLMPLFIRLTLYVFDRPLRHDNFPGELTSPVMPEDMCSIDPAATIFNFVRRLTDLPAETKRVHVKRRQATTVSLRAGRSAVT
jgi:hypothetical protein